MSRTTIALAGLGGLLLLLTLAALLLHLPRVDTALPIPERETAVGILVLQGLAYLVAVVVVLRHGSTRRATWIVLAVASLMRVAFVFEHPVLSSDIYRYVWDGQVQNAGINPYRYLPVDPALRKLRDPDVFPLINRANYAHTIYPPAAQIIFAGVGRITKSVTGMKLAMVAFELLACWCMLQMLAIARLPAERLLIYAWNPLAQWSFSFDGHIDAAAIGLLALALLLRARHRTGLAGAVLAGATLVKFFPVVVAPAFIRGGRFWRPALAGLLVVAGLYGLYASVGARVFGFLTGYDAEEGLTNGAGIWLLSPLSWLNDRTDLVDLPDDFGKFYLLAAAAAMALLGVWIARRRTPSTPSDEAATDVVVLCRDTAILAGCTMVLISPHFPWYFPWLALPAVIAPLASVIWLSVAPVILYLDPGTEHVLWGSFVYVPAIALAGFEFWKSRKAGPANAPLSIEERERCPPP
jgi:hypothetical protein